MTVLLHSSHGRNHSNKTCLIKGMLEAWNAAVGIGDDWESKQRSTSAG
jgi:hypothetical protein